MSVRPSYVAFLLPLGVVVLFLLLWQVIVVWSGRTLFPTPIEAGLGLIELAEKGLLVKYIVASLFRVTWGFVLAAVVGIPFGLVLGWFPRAQLAFNPLIQALRPISPIAWIPLAILWFGVGNLSPVFLIFISSVFPMIVQTTSGVHTIDRRYLRAAANFGVSRSTLFKQVIIPAVL